MRTRPRNAGMTILELSISVVLFGTVLGSAGLVWRATSRANATGSARSELESASNRALLEIASNLQGSGFGGIPAAYPAAGPLWSWSQLDYQRVTGFAGGLQTWADLERIQLEPEPGDPDDGVDNDGDGLVDECRVVRIESFGQPDQRSFVLCHGVREFLADEIGGNGVDDNGNGLIDERGLSMRFDGERIEVLITLESRDSFGTQLTSTARHVVTLRN